MTQKITAIGEILFDVYPDYKKLGGAPFNFIYHIWKLTGEGKFISKVGNDEDGKSILEQLQQRNFETSYLQKDENYLTGKVEVKLNSDKVPEFNILEDKAYDYIESNSSIKRLVQESDLYYFGTLAQRNQTSRNTILELGNAAQKRFCDLNIRQNFYTEEIISNSLELSDVVKLSSDELKLVNRLLIRKEFDLINSSKKILEGFNIELLCVTLGDEGAYLIKNDQVSHYKEKVNNIVDTVGAGDAYAAILAIGYISDWDLNRINKIASKFAASLCTIEGAIPANDNLYNKFREQITNG